MRAREKTEKLSVVADEVSNVVDLLFVICVAAGQMVTVACMPQLLLELNSQLAVVGVDTQS